MQQSISRNELIEIIKEILREMHEASTTANVPGYQTPYAFSGGLAKNKKKKKDLIKRLHMKLVGKLDESSLNEGRYHEYRNDDSLTAKQKIGYSMREVRDKLNELSKLIDMNVKLKNELNVDTKTYWKNTHKAMSKISERLVKLANKVGKLQ